MIIENTPLSMAESQKYIGDSDSNKELKKFIKNFTKLSDKDGKEMRQKIEVLDLMKLKGEQISKIIDTMPETQEDINKILTGISLDEDESKKVIEIVKQYK